MYLYDSEGNELISYHPYKLDRTKPMPDPVVPLNPDPKSVENTEEVYYLGMRNLQFHNAHVDPNDYFFEVVRRDPATCAPTRSSASTTGSRAISPGPRSTCGPPSNGRPPTRPASATGSRCTTSA